MPCRRRITREAELLIAANNGVLRLPVEDLDVPIVDQIERYFRHRYGYQCDRTLPLA